MENPPKYTWKFWAVFWLVAVFLLAGWYIFLQIQNKNIENLKPLVNLAPIGSEQKNELKVLADVYSKMGGFQREQTFLVLFQNDMELRPGGGFLGSFGIVKVKEGKISDLQVYDTGVFDGRIPDTETPPYPLGETFHIKSWKMRDSNWSPDFRANAEKAEYFYKLGGGSAFAEAPIADESLMGKSADKKNFDGVIAINTAVLNSILAITGPVKIDEYPGEYNDETAILQLEYQVEKGFAEQGIEKGERKNIMKELAAILAEKAHNFTFRQQLELGRKIEEHLQRKDIQLFFKDAGLQKEVEEMNWGGEVKNYGGDYLMVVDANLNSLKSDICVRRRADYYADFSGDVPRAELKITYEHTCRTRDWMTTNYNDWARVYAPSGAYLTQASGQEGNVVFADELGKKIFGFNVYVPIGEAKIITLKYNLPKEIVGENYNLLIQKQSGSGELPVKITLKKASGETKTINDVLVGDKNFSL